MASVLKWLVNILIHIGIPVSILTAVKDDEGKDTEEKHWEQIKCAQALWTRNKSDIEKEEYQEFYKHVSQWLCWFTNVEP